MKGNEMFFQIIYIYIYCAFVGVFQCYTGEGIKIQRKQYDKENRKS